MGGNSVHNRGEKKREVLIMWTLHGVRYFTGHPSILLVLAALDPRTMLNASGLDNKACEQFLTWTWLSSVSLNLMLGSSVTNISGSLSSKGHHPEQIHLVVSVFVF